MSQPAPSFAIRSLAGSGTTLHQLRRAILDAPPSSGLVLLRLQNSPVRFPSICPNCEQPATAAIPIQRAFLFHVHSDSDTPNDTLESIDAFTVPFCFTCIQKHRAQQSPLSPWTPLRRILSSGEGLASLFVLGIALMFVYSAIERLSVFPLVLATLPFAIGFWLLRTTWQKTRHMSVAKPTAVDLTVDFTPSIALPFEPHWRAFQFRSPHYAGLFRQANIDDLWNPQSTEAQAAAAQRRERTTSSNLVVGAVIVAVLLYGLWDFLSQYIRPLLER